MVANAKESYPGPSAPAQVAPPPARAAVQAPEAPKKSPLGKIIFAAVVAVGAVLGGGYWYTQRNLETTDNAQIDADVVLVPSRAAGLVTKVYFTENQTVKEGDKLAELDPLPAKAKLAEAKAALVVAQASAEAADADVRVSESNAKGNKAVSDAAVNTAAVGATSASDQIKEADAALKSAETSNEQAKTDLDRAKSLFQAGAYTKAQLDQAQTAYDVTSSALTGARARVSTVRSSAAQAQSRIVEATAKATQSNDVDSVVKQAAAKAASAHAQVDNAKAQVDLAELDLSYTTILAPHDGVVSKKSVNEGQTVAAGQSIVQLVTPDRWVTANFKETQVQKMRIGQQAEFEVDAISGVKFHGTVESFSGATGARFTLLPPDNASGNFTKVVQRVPVRIKIASLPENARLTPGLSVDLTVDTASKSQ